MQLDLLATDDAAVEEISASIASTTAAQEIRIEFKDASRIGGGLWRAWSPEEESKLKGWVKGFCHEYGAGSHWLAMRPAPSSHGMKS